MFGNTIGKPRHKSTKNITNKKSRHKSIGTRVFFTNGVLSKAIKMITL